MDARVIKRRLLALVDDLAKVSWLFSINPSSDFTRHRKLDFATVIRILLSMQSGCLRSELQEFFRFSADCPSASAFVQQRIKLLPETLAVLFRAFNEKFPCRKTYRGYHLLACDGSDLNIARNPSDADTYFQYSLVNKAILIADRGYESYNLFAHIQEKGLFYLVRVRDGNSLISRMRFSCAVNACEAAYLRGIWWRRFRNTFCQFAPVGVFSARSNRSQR